MVTPHERHEKKLQKEIDHLRTEIENTIKFGALLACDDLKGREYIHHLIAELQHKLDCLLLKAATLTP